MNQTFAKTINFKTQRQLSSFYLFILQSFEKQNIVRTDIIKTQNNQIIYNSSIKAG